MAGNEVNLSIDTLEYNFSGADSVVVRKNQLVITPNYVHIIFEGVPHYIQSDKVCKLFIPKKYWKYLREKLGFTGNWVNARSFGVLQKQWSSANMENGIFLYNTEAGVNIYWYNRGTGDLFVYINEIFYYKH